MRFNINHDVRVKLTDQGRAILKKKHENFYRALPVALIPPFRPKPEDGDGWSEWQLWDLMATFGEHLYNGCKVPFDPEIEILSKAVE